MLDDLTPLSEEELRVVKRAVAAIYRDAVAHVLRADGYVQRTADYRAMTRIGSRLHWFALGAFVGGFVTFLATVILLAPA